MKYDYDPPHCYLEMARGAFTSIHHQLKEDEFIRVHGRAPLANAKLALVSMSVIYSFMAIEAFVNAQLFSIWERRTDGAAEANAFVSRFGVINEFSELRKHQYAKELPERYKSLCHILGFVTPDKEIPDTWRRFNVLVKRSRHFFVHASPEPKYFQDNMQRLMEDTKSGEYVKIAEEMLRYLFASSDKDPPNWLSRNTLLKFRGIDLLAK